jgi:hypothetical protein
LGAASLLMAEMAPDHLTTVRAIPFDPFPVFESGQEGIAFLNMLSQIFLPWGEDHLPTP